jgi:hypothetical protein
VASLSENEIKQLSLKFLKEYYRYRQREGGIELSSDLRGAGGIIADGFLSFPLKGGEQFQAAFEATSRDTRDEVRYQLDRQLLLWDAMALGMFVGAAALTAGNIAGWLTFKNVTWAGCLAAVVIAAIFAAMLFAAFAFNWRRYRYIYAIEQFKQYHANEQWVAIGEDVFANYYDDRYYQELRQQCISNGFGLLIIRQSGAPLMQITPARQSLFKRRRREVSFFSQEDLARFAELGSLPKWMKKFKADNFMRFERQRRFQLVVIGISLLMISGIFYLESQKVEEVFETPEQYLARMALARQRNEGSRQSTAFVIDTPYVWPPPVLREQDTRPYIDLSSPAAERPAARAPKPQGPPDFLLSMPGGKLAVYDCTRLRNVQGTVYLLREGWYADYKAAEARILDLAQYELEASGLRLACFDQRDQRYAVFFGDIYDSQENVQRALQDYRTRLADNVLGITIDIHAITITKPR